jgi:hypothetical protein
MRRLAPAVVLALLAAGCGGGGGSAPKTASTAASSSGPAPPPASVKPGAPAKAIDGRDSTVDGDPARLDILSLTRSGGVSQITLRLANTNLPDAQGSMQIGDTFDDGANDTTTKPNKPFTLDGIALIDAVNRKKYLVARDTAGECICDGGLSSQFVEPGRSLNLSATFGAPPPDVKAVNVFVPRFGTFRNVPIS